jgi:hypothetical protein
LPASSRKRSAFQIAMKHTFIAALDRLSGRNVLAFISNQHVGPPARQSATSATPGRPVLAATGRQREVHLEATSTG